MSKKRNRKKPTKKIRLSEERKARGGKKAEKYDHAVLVWYTDAIDDGGKWSWKKIRPKTWFRHICPAKHNFSTMKWSEIKGDRHHSVPTCRIIKEAKDRLFDIDQGDVDTLYSLAIGGEKRIWGIKSENKFKVLWWDPNHEICTSPKQHT